jgi:hypothetical protein
MHSNIIRVDGGSSSISAGKRAARGMPGGRGASHEDSQHQLIADYLAAMSISLLGEVVVEEGCWRTSRLMNNLLGWLSDSAAILIAMNQYGYMPNKPDHRLLK